MLKNFYRLLCIVGTVLPYSQFIPFLWENGLDLKLFIEQLFANRISSFFAMDLIITSLVLWIFIYVEGTRLKMKHLWVYVASTLTVGVSLALPLFLLRRQQNLEQQPDRSLDFSGEVG